MKEFIAGMLVCVVTVVVIAVLKERGPTLNTRDGEYYLRTLVFEFQTLLTGVLAVGAALITVLQMRASDEKGDQRHLQSLNAASEQHKASMRLALRGERLRVHRALHPQFRELKDIRKSMMRVDREYRLMWYDPDAAARNGSSYSKANFEAFAIELYPLISQVKEIFERPQLEEGSKLFDGDLTYRIADIVHHVQRVESCARFFYDYFHSDANQRTDADSRAFLSQVNLGGDRLILRFPRVFESKINWILEGMREMATVYDVEERWTD